MAKRDLAGKRAWAAGGGADIAEGAAALASAEAVPRDRASFLAEPPPRKGSNDA